MHTVFEEPLFHIHVGWGISFFQSHNTFSYAIDLAYATLETESATAW